MALVEILCTLCRGGVCDFVAVGLAFLGVVYELDKSFARGPPPLHTKHCSCNFKSSIYVNLYKNNYEISCVSINFTKQFLIFQTVLLLL